MKTYQSVVKSITLCAGLLLLAGALNVQAVTYTKDNNTTRIDSGSSWVGLTAPTSADVGLFDSTITGPITTANISANYQPGGFQVLNPGGLVTIGVVGSGSTTLTINGGAGITYLIDMSAATTNFTVGTGVGFGTMRIASAANFSQTSGGLIVAANQTLTINSVFSNQGNNKTVPLVGPGNIVLNGVAGGGTAFGFSIRSNAVVTMNNANSWGGTSSKEIIAGTLNLGNDGALSAVTLTMGGTSSTNPILTAVGGTRTIANGIILAAVTSGNAVIAGASPLTVNGSLAVSGGNRTLTVSNTALTTFGGPVSLSEGGTTRTLTLNGPGNVTILGPITNGVTATSGNLTYSGTGTLALGGTNTYKGTTLVSSGELAGITGGSLSNTAAIIVAAGATNGVQLATAGGQFVCTNLVATNASYMDFNFNGFAPSTTTAPLLVLGNLATTNIVSILVRNGAFGVGTYPLVTCTGTLTGTVTNVPTGLLPNRATGYISNDLVTTKTIYLVVTNASAEPLTWAVGDSTWDTSTANWFDKFGNAATYADPAFDQVVFDDTASGASPITVTLSSLVTPVSVTANLTNKSYTISGAGGSIAGSASLVKNGAGILTLNTANGYAGGTLIAGGTIALNSLTSGATGCGVGTGTVTLTNGGALALWSSSAGDPGTVNGATFTNAIVVPSGQSGTVSNAWRGTFSSTVTGGGTLNFNVNGTRGEVTGNNWSGYTGQINVTPRGSADFRINNTGGTVSFGTAALNLGSSVIMYEVGNYSTNGQTITIGEVSGAGTMSGGTSTAFTRVLTYLVGGRNTSATFSGVIQDNARQTAVIKQGTGVWALAGASTYTGSTLVSNGVLEVDGALGSTAVTNYAGATLAGTGTLAGVVDLEAGSTLAPGIAGVGNYGTFTCSGGLFVNNNSTNVFDVSTNGCDMIVAASGLYLSGSDIVKLNITGPLTNGIYPLFEYSSIGTGSVANLALSPANFGTQTLSLVDDSAGNIVLVVASAGAASLTWDNNSGNGYWDVSTSANWTNSVSHAVENYLDGDSVTFDLTGAASPAVDVRSSVAPKGVVVNSSSDYTFANNNGLGQISGVLTNGFVKNGAGALTILTKNNYTGPTLLNGGGVVTVGDGNTLGTSISSGPVTNNTLLVFNQPDNAVIAGDLTGVGSLVKSGAGTLTIQGNTTLTGTNLIDTGTLQLGIGGATAIPTNKFVLANHGLLAIKRSGSYTVTNPITGLGGVNLGGAATTIFGGAHTYLDNTYISGGLVQLSAANVIPSAAIVPGSTGWLILDGGATAGTLDINGFDLTVNALSGLTGAAVGVITNTSGSTTTNILTINSTADSGFAGKIQENGAGAKIALVMSGANTQTLSVANSYSGGTTIVGPGTLMIGSAGSLGTGMITLTNGGTLGASVNNLQLQGDNLTVPAANTGTINMTAQVRLPALYGPGTLNLNVNNSHIVDSGHLGDSFSACVNFTGIVNIYGQVTLAEMDCAFNGGSFDGHLENATVNLFAGAGGGVSLVGVNGSTGNTGQFGALNVDASSSLGGAAYAGTMTYQIGALNTDSVINGNIVNNVNTGGRSVIIKVGTGKLFLNGSDTYTGNTTVNAGSIIVGTSSFMANSPVITVSTNAVLDVSAVGTTYFGNTVPQTLAGSGVVTGVVAAVNAAINPGGSGTVGTLSFSNSLALIGGVTNNFDLPVSGPNDQLAVAGALDISGSGNQFNINALNSTILPGTYTLATFSGPLLSSGGPVDAGAITNYVALGGAIAAQTRFITLSNSANAIVLVVGSGSPLVWAGDGSANKWDLTNSPDWSGPSAFYQNDGVTFNDTSSNPTVNLTGTLAPASITVASSSNYVFASTGKLTAGTGIAKSGTGTLTIANSGGNDYNGQVAVSGGILKAGVATALGSTNGSTVISGTGALDVGGFNLGAEPVTVSGAGTGNGAILNSGAAALNALQFVTLAADTTFGGTNRWDIRTNALGAYLQGNGHNLTKVSANDIYLVNVGNANLGDVQIQQGRIGVQNNTALGGGGTLTLFAGAGLDLWDTTVTNTRAVSLTNATMSSSSSANVYGGPITLTGMGTFTAATPLQLNSPLGGAGGLLKNGVSTLTLAGTNNYSGVTTISNGVLALVGTASISNSTAIDVTAGALLDVSGLAGGLFTLHSGQTLQGIGTVNGSVTAPAGSTVSPGEGAIGTLTVTNTISLAGNTVMEINRSGAPTCDLIVATNIQYGGTLTVNNLGGAPQLFDSFKLFKGAYSGAFVSSNLPALGTGLVWTNTLAVNGSIAVVAGPTTNPNATNITAVVTGTTLSLTWPGDHLGWTLLTNSLDLANPTDWHPYPGSASVTNVDITINPGQPNVYFRMAYPYP